MGQGIKTYKNAVDIIKTAILQSQARAAKVVNQEQLALYYGIGRYVSANTRKKNWGQGAIEAISSQLKLELPGLRGFSARNIKNMRIFYEGWCMLERPNSAVSTAEFTEFNTKSSVTTDEMGQAIVNSAVVTAEFEDDREIRQLQLANLPDFPLREFLSISFTHHIAILAKSKSYDDSIEYEGRIYKLSPFVGTFMPEEHRNTSGAYQGAKYFSYNGKVLDEIRKENEINRKKS